MGGAWISCGAGWFPLITQIHTQLVDLDSSYTVLQVKEKYGVLRYYAETTSGDAAIVEQFCAVTAEAERRSAVICERCGGPGELCPATSNSRS
jgi:hypothetical protein